MKIAFLSCKNAKHNCAGAADCLRMFQERTGEFAIYSPDDWIAAVVPCSYCVQHEQAFSKFLEAWANPKNQIRHIHLGACTSICPCKNYQEIKEFFLKQGFTVGEYIDSPGKA